MKLQLISEVGVIAEDVQEVLETYQVDTLRELSDHLDEIFRTAHLTPPAEEERPGKLRAQDLKRFTFGGKKDVGGAAGPSKFKPGQVVKMGGALYKILDVTNRKHEAKIKAKHPFITPEQVPLMNLQTGEVSVPYVDELSGLRPGEVHGQQGWVQ